MTCIIVKLLQPFYEKSSIIDEGFGSPILLEIHFSIPEQRFYATLNGVDLGHLDLPLEESNFEFASLEVEGDWDLNFVGAMAIGKEMF